MWALYILGLAYFVQRAEGVFGGRPPNKWDVEASFVVPILDALSGEYICTGSILTSQHVMTAASCFVDLSSGVAKMVHRNSIVGVGASTTNSPEMKVHPVGQIKTHPSYNINNLKYHPADVVDLAVIRLQTHIAFGPNDKARAAVIATDETSHLLTQDRPAKNVIGFGITQLPRQGDTSPLQFSTTAQSAEVIIRSGDYCQWSSDIYHQNSLKRVTYFDSKYHLCATVASNRGACTGDVGAPLTFLGKAPMGTLPQNGRTVNVKTQDRPFIVGLYQGLAPGGECGRATIAADVLKALGMVDEKPVPDPNAPALPPSTPNYARFVNLLYWGPWVQAATGTVLPATYYVGKYVPPKKLPEFPPLVRQPASKCGRCPGQANAKDCWCDAECEKNGDCCADFIDSGCKKKIAGDQEKAVQGGAAAQPLECVASNPVPAGATRTVPHTGTAAAISACSAALSLPTSPSLAWGSAVSRATGVGATLSARRTRIAAQTTTSALLLRLKAVGLASANAVSSQAAAGVTTRAWPTTTAVPTTSHAVERRDLARATVGSNQARSAGATQRACAQETAAPISMPSVQKPSCPTKWKQQFCKMGAAAVVACSSRHPGHKSS
eukprot:CAMPEP_0175091194 /NCGR_PEP_ID=MMETSP0086_2-20121207/1768_1 /TAXON_ID=136419 /ORGANISM="Unknown Unknown, Strain D1" /LENGTH=608 /DNA_ID=CAMNT_0016363911 /DNA_START=61 /DNA_END=1888 /DNA_ORIENTATION=+